MHPIKRLLIFQIKLAADALRDILMSPISLVFTLIDSIQNNRGQNSYFEKLMQFGRNTEKRINLFEQHEEDVSSDCKDVSIDSILNRVEGVILKEYKNKPISKKAMAAIENAIKKQAKGI